ncbi:MAG: DNA polymerase III subunit beta [Bryobacterales bacterium]|nr:DNA polymerase III subunit beta [Bryobacterales bacterium]
MEFTVSKGDLVRELNLSQGVVEKKTTIPILSNILIETGEDQIILTATDLELGIRCSCPARIVRKGAGTVPAKRLLDYVRLLPDADVNVKFQENHWASLVCGRSRTRIAGMSRESFPELPAIPAPVASFPASTLAGMIGRTIFAISNEESRFTLNGALLVLRPATMVMVSTDGHRLAMVETLSEIPGVKTMERALLPRKAMGEILKLVADSGENDQIEFSSDDNHLFFRFGERLLISRKLTGNFPDYERVLPKEQPQRIRVANAELRAGIERVSQFADERSRAVKVQVGPGELKIYSSLSDTGESEESMPLEYDGPTVEIGFNAQYMLDFLRAASEESVDFLFKDGESAGELRPAGDGTGFNNRYVVMPMRI